MDQKNHHQLFPSSSSSNQHHPVHLPPISSLQESQNFGTNNNLNFDGQNSLSPNYSLPEPLPPLQINTPSSSALETPTNPKFPLSLPLSSASSFQIKHASTLPATLEKQHRLGNNNRPKQVPLLSVTSAPPNMDPNSSNSNSTKLPNNPAINRSPPVFDFR